MSPPRGLSPTYVLVGGVALLVGAVVLSLTIGQGNVTLDQAYAAVLGADPSNNAHIIVRQVRLPRALLAVLVGAALAVSGALMQSLTRNPLAEPGLLGVTGGASFAVVVATQYGASGQAVALIVAFVGASMAAVVVYAVGRSDPLRLVLAGVALTAVLAGVSVGIRLTSPTTFDAYRFWSVGSLAGREQAPLILPCIVMSVALCGALLLGKPLNAVMLGDDVAHGLGVKVVRTRVLTLFVATVLAATATAVAGPIVFLGLIVPHVVRWLTQASIGWLICLCVVVGPLLTVLSDVLARMLLETGEVPVAIVTAVIGGPVLIWVVRRQGVVSV